MNSHLTERESVASVARKWLPWCLALIFIMTIGWTALVAWHEIRHGGHENAVRLAVAIGKDAASVQPMIVVYAIFAVTALDAGGSAIVVTYRYLSKKFLEPLDRKFEERVREQVEERMRQGFDEQVRQEIDEQVRQGVEERIRQGIEQRIRQGIHQEVREQVQQNMIQMQLLLQEWENWNARREESIENGIPFDEPPPGR